MRIAAVGNAALLATTVASAAWAQGPPAGPVTAPVVLEHVDAVYPPSALERGADATVVVAVTVDTDGHVTKVDVLDSGGADLDEAAVVAARQWTFVPAIRDGKAVRSRIRVPFHFAPPAPPPELVAPPATAEPEVPVHLAVPQGSLRAPVGRVPEPPSASPDPERVEVIGHLAPPSVGASDFNLRVGGLANVPRQNATELLRLAPGILLTNEGGEGHAEQVFLRLFDAREGQDIEFSVGGVPINESGNPHGNGYADTHFIIPELVDSLRVVEGPFDPRQGNYAVAGSADYHLALRRRGLGAALTFGSFNTRRLLVEWGPKGESDQTFAGAEIYSTDGFGQNRDAVRGTAMAQYEGLVGSHGSYTLTATAYSTHYHSAGVIRDDDYRTGRIGFFDTYDARQGGDASRFSLAGSVETRVGPTHLEQQAFVVRRDMRLRENFTGFLLDVQEPLQTPHAQRGDLLDLLAGETTYGAKGFSRFRGMAFGQPQQLELGYFARGDSVTGLQQRIDQTNHPYRTEINLVSTLADLGLYADVDVKPISWLSLRGGVREELLTYDVSDLCAVQDVAHPATPTNDASCLSQREFGAHVEPNLQSSTASTALLPRGAILVGPFSGFSFSVNYGQGIRSVDPNYVTQDVETPFASITGYDGGVIYSRDLRGVALAVRSVAFTTHVDKDYVFSQNAGRNVLGVGTTRTGWLGAVRANGSWFDESANVTVGKATFDDTQLLVPYVPDVVVRSDTAVYSTLAVPLTTERAQGSLSLGVTYVGSRALPYGQRSNDIFTVDASARLAWREYALTLGVTNLLDNRYRLGEYNYASDFRSQSEPTLVPMRHFAAGASRAIFATLSVALGGT